MFKVLFLMLILLAGLVAGPYLSGKQGYVLISTANHDIEMTIPTLVILFVLSLAVVYLIQAAISRFCSLNKSTYGWFSRRKRLKAEKQTLAGLIKMDEGDYAKAEKLIGKNAKHASEPVLNFIKAAEAAQQKGDEFSANKYLIEATKLAGNDNLIVELARTRILLQQGKLSAARSSIDSLLLLAPYNPEVLRLAIEIYLQSKAYTSLDELFSRVENKLNYTPEKLNQLRQQIEDGLQDEKLNEDGVDGLLAWWEEQPRKRHNDIYAKIGMVKRLIAANDHDSAYQIALETIKKVDRKTDRLALLQQLPHLQLESDSKLIKILEKQLRNENDDELKVAYNRALGYLDIRLNEFESAKTYLNNVLAAPHLVKSSDFTMAAYTYEQLNDPSNAQKVREQGLQYVMKSQKNPPAMETNVAAVNN
ncbi:HemY protein [Pasteurella testudinis DSM 23072]|uniref:HemY protein n=1 Tax=Pasteurella testudinis DSM 23072 TaxID=1122938 RepID=A0A1W1UT56_9PAST|nr:heme biosynthesis HemY N-terminal domain-containing protein [Pasteurella testudinis]SMB84233.1 HemY protein [Pasteurella testudinis DSM 23072]SUB50872.1 protein hemY [Pasteurella testudinis]